MTTAREDPPPSVCVQESVLAAPVLAAWLTASCVICGLAKVAVIFFAASTVTVAGFVEPDRSPLHPVNLAPEFGVAVNVTVVPVA